jgi:uncharacterized protein with GYD domain
VANPSSLAAAQAALEAVRQTPDQPGSEVRFGLSKFGGYELSVILQEVPDQETLLRLAAQSNPLRVIETGLAACEALDAKS